MVDTQVRPSDVTKFPIIEAMLAVPREAFVPDMHREAAYVGDCISLGAGRVVLEPRTFAKMLDGLNIQPNELVLDVGCGLGYSSAVISRMAEAVVALEQDPDMALRAERLLGDTGAHNVAVIQGPLDAGSAKHGPYDAIIIQGGIEVLPGALEAQLKDGGRVAAVFVENALGSCKIGYKSNGSITWRQTFDAGLPVLAGFEATRAFAL